MTLLRVRREFSGAAAGTLSFLSFLLPLALWAALSYVPWLWHPEVRVTLPGASDYKIDDQLPGNDFSVLRQRFLTQEAPSNTPSEREILRSLRPWGEWLLASKLIEPAHIRDAALLRNKLAQWESLDLVPPPDAENSAILAAFTQADAGSALPPLLPQGNRCNPIFLPAPHEVVIALYAGFSEEPRRADDKRLHERLAESASLIAQGFGLALVIALPLGLLCGTFDLFRRLIEPFTAFFSYIPPPAFGALLIAISGIYDGPKISMIFIAAAFPLLLMIAKTTRLVDGRLLEAAQVLGARPGQLVTRIILPAALPNIWNDVRIVIAMAWTILIIAELTGEKSGISSYINTMGRYRQYDNVFASILLIGFAGLIIDKAMAMLHPLLFPWQGSQANPQLRWTISALLWLPRLILRAHLRHIERFATLPERAP